MSAASLDILPRCAVHGKCCAVRRDGARQNSNGARRPPLELAYSEDRLAQLKKEYEFAAKQPSNLRYGRVTAARISFETSAGEPRRSRGAAEVRT